MGSASREARGDRIALVVLAAGAGTRMRSALPKPLHPIAGLPMIEHVLRAAAAARPHSTTLVVGPHTAEIASHLARTASLSSVMQDPPRGTGDAVRTALPEIGEADLIVVLYADQPLLTPDTIARLIDGARTSGALVTVLTRVLTDGSGYGRIERDRDRRPVRVVEAADDDPARRNGEIEINSGMMALSAAWARQALARLTPSRTKGEYYLTDLVELAVLDHATSTGPWPVETVAADPETLLGVNDRIELARAEAIIRDRVRQRLLFSGVTLVDPASAMIDVDVEIGADTTILPFTMIERGTTIGSGCRIGPHAHLRNAAIGDRVTILASTVVDSSIGDDADVGPYAHVRKGTIVDGNVHIGNFAELKNARLATGVKVGHVSYLGDAIVGKGTNIGAGTITCNFDGVAKHHTEIGDGAFIGSDTMLVAPVTIGDGARTGAGSVVTRDVEPGVTVVGVPARPIGRRSSAAASTEATKGADKS